jgi:hypothetical protein
VVKMKIVRTKRFVSTSLRQSAIPRCKRGLQTCPIPFVGPSSTLRPPFPRPSSRLRALGLPRRDGGIRCPTPLPRGRGTDFRPLAGARGSDCFRVSAFPRFSVSRCLVAPLLSCMRLELLDFWTFGRFQHRSFAVAVLLTARQEPRPPKSVYNRRADTTFLMMER